MKLPRDVSGSDLERGLGRAFGYRFTRQVGSHRRLTTHTKGEHHLTVPAHNPLKPGTLRAILREVSKHNDMDEQAVLELLDL